MPRARLPQLHSITDGSFEPNRKNPILLGDDDVLDVHQKTIKIGGLPSPLSLSTDELRINGDLFFSGKLSSHKIETDNLYLDFISGDSGYFRLFPKNITAGREYFISTTGTAVLHSAYGDFNMHSSNGNLNLTSANGDINLHPSGGNVEFIDGDSETIFDFNVDDCELTLKNDENVYDYFKIAITDDGVSTISTTNHGGAVGHLTLDVDGDIILDPVSGITKFYLSGDTDDLCTLTVAANGVTSIATADSDGAVGHLTLVPDGDLILDPVSTKTIINATDGLYFDGGSDTYIYEQGADALRVMVGGDILMQLSEKGDDGNEVNFASSCVGFTQLEPVYDATATTVDFRHSNKQFLTFGSGNTGHILLYFPLVSGNFTLLIKQDGTGSRVNLGSWKVYEFDESLADGATGVKFAGGSAPTLTTDANHVDIISFYWDADNEIAYGVATLDFQF